TAAPLAQTVTSGDAQTAPSFQMPQVLERTQAALWTGDLTFSYPLALAPARAGFGPALALSYSSAAANGAVSTLRIPESDDERRAVQGGVLGYGWNLDLPTISKGGEWYGHETEGFTLNLGGQSYELVYSGSDNLWTTRPESFFRIMHDNSTAAIPNQDRGCSYYDSTPPASWETKYVPKVAALAQPWYVWTPDGTFYQFGGYAGSGYLDRGIGGAHNDATLYWVSATGWTGCNLSAITFVASQWGLVKAVDPHGNQYDITWNVWSDIGCLGWCDRQYGDNEGIARALAPHEISYAGGKVTFEYASGGDGNHPAPIPALRADGRGKLNAEWSDERLSRIVAQRQTGETTYQEVRRYEFAVGRPATSQWHETLQRIAWFGRDDNGVWQFPADVTFAYTQLGNQGAHALYLTEISNGAGGAQTANYVWQGDIGVPTGDQDCWAGQNGRYVLNTLTTADGRGTSVTSYGFNTPQSYGTCTNSYANRYEFLGFADSWAQVGNRRTRQWTHQKYAQTPDLRRGLAYQVTVEDATWGTILQQTETTWKCVASATENPTGSGVCAARDPAAPRWLRKDAVLTTLDGLPQERRYNYWADGNLQYDWEYGPDTAGNLAYYRVTYVEWGTYRVASGAPAQQKYLFRPKRTYVHRAPDNYCVQGVEYDYGGGYVANPTAAGDLVGQRTALANLHCSAGDGYAETRFTYDAWGNRTQAETLIGGAGSASNPKTTTVYDSLGVSPVAQTVVTGGSDLVTSTAYDAYGRPRETTASNGVKLRQTYDAWGRLCLVERAPAGGGYAAQQATAYSDAWRLPGGCADAANFADGSGGLNTLPLTLVEGEAFTSQSGMLAWDAKAAAAGGYVLGAGWGGAAGNYAQYDALSFGWAGGNTFLRLRYANNTGHANTLQVFVDGVAKGNVTCEHTGGWGDQSRDYREVTLDLGSIAPGSHSLKLSVTVAGAYTNVDRFTLTGGGLRVVGTKTFGPPPAAGTADPLTGGQFSYTYHDGLGRPVTVQTERNSPSGAAWATTHQEYDSLGRVSAETLPYAVTARGGAVPDPNPNPRRTT
ncbi:MAG: hypothetical protein QG637_36, partial [Chloroflexota bacterium]|nr:hypothetical protein [Chloroflexota bacterium]